MTSVQLLCHLPITKESRSDWHAVMTHTHTYSGRDDHGGTIKPPESYEGLVAWAKRANIAAMAMGSAYTPATAKQYDRFDGDGRVEYYSGEIDQLSVRGDDEIAAMLAQVNEMAEGDTHFFLDNETPKGRYGHLWWVNYALDYPAWHDFDQDFDRWMLHESRDDSDEPMPYARRPYREIIALQRAQGAVANWAHPTSWWFGDNGQFITNIASEMPAHLIADGYVDGMVVMGYRAFRPEYQNLWFSLLDKGYRVPGVAEMDAGLSDSKLWRRKNAYVTLVQLARKPQSSVEIAREWQSGKLIASSCAWVQLKVDGVPMGEVAASDANAVHQVEITFGGEAARYDIELIGPGGEVVWNGHNLEAGIIKLTATGTTQRGYLVARVFGMNVDESRDTEIHGVSTPVYLHPRGESFEKPATTNLTVEFLPSSRWCGGEVHFETDAGESLGCTSIKGSVIQEVVPAGGRITLCDADGVRETHYLINANRKLNDVQRYLYRGRFLRDAPDLQPGQVPPEMWRFDNYREAMQALTLSF